jgi:hypothetical protein
MSEISTFSQINPQKLKTLSINNSGKSTILKNEIVDFILKDIQKIPNSQSLKNDVEILLHICNLIENLISKNKQKINKKQLVIDIMTQVFYLNSDDEKNALEKQIQFLYDNKLIIKVTTLNQVLKKAFSIANFIFKS